jgi:hypothetical protein
MGPWFRDALADKISHGWKDLPRIFRDVGLTGVEEDVVSSNRVVEWDGCYIWVGEFGFVSGWGGSYGH